MTDLRLDAGDRSLLRRMNSHAVLLSVRERAQTATELAQELGISRTAIEDVLKDLLALGWISGADDAERPSRPGRPAKRYVFAADAGHVAGIDIGVHSVTARIADLAGEPLGTARCTVDVRATVSERFDAAAEAFAGACAEAGVEAGGVWLAGVGVPGVIDARGVVLAYGGDGMPGWAGTDVRSSLGRRLGVPTVVQSDSTMAVVAEHWRGAATEAQDVVFILSGNRTSAGLLLGGEPHRGVRGGAGLVGALPELGWASAPAFVEGLSAHGIEPTREAMFAAAERGDPVAVEALDGFAGALARGIAAMALAVDPELIVLGGGVSRGGDTILNPVRSHLDRILGEGRAPLELSTLGSDATSIGAVRAALVQVDANLARLGRTAPGFPRPARVLGAGE